MQVLKRCVAVIAAVVLMAGVLAVRPASASGAGLFLYVANDHDNTVAVIDANTGTKVKTIPVGNEPRPVVSLPSQHKVYVANTYGQSISVIDTTTDTVSKTIPLASDEYVLTLALNHAGTRLYAADWGTDGTISVIDTSTDTVLTTLTNYASPQGMAFSNDDSTMYVVNSNCCASTSGFVSVVDTTTYSVQATIPLGQEPTGIALLPDGSKAYISVNGGASQGNTVAVIDLATNTVMQQITVDVNPYGIVANSTGTRVYVTNTQYWNGAPNSTVSVIDTATDTVLQTIPVGYIANVLQISPDDSRVFTVNNGANTVSVIDTATNAVINTIPNIGDNGGTNPWGIAVVEGTAQPSTVTLNASADTNIRSGQDNRNYGASDFMRLQSSGNNRALVRFDQTALSADIGSGQVLSAKLRLTITDNANNWGTTGRTIDAHRLFTDWAEGNGTEASRGSGSGATWACAIDSIIENQSKNCNCVAEWEMGQPNNASVHPWAETPTATQTISNGQSGVLEFDVTADLTAFMNGSSSNYGWLLKKTAEGQNGQVSFGTKESTSIPQLVVTYWP